MVFSPNSNRKFLSAVLACAMLLCTLTGCGAAQQQESDGLKIGYATEGVTAVEDEDALQKAVDEMYKKAAEGSIALEFKNTAISKDGVNFELYLANSESNSYDMFIAIYGDAELTDQLFLSGLLRPGTAFSTLTLDHALEPGTHTVYVVHTQVEEDLETIHAQVVITMEFVVNK